MTGQIATLTVFAQTEDDTASFPYWLVFLILSAIVWLLIARAVKRRLDGMENARPVTTPTGDVTGDAIGEGPLETRPDA